MDNLVTQRTVCKASITRIATWLDKNISETDKYAFKFRLDSLESHFHRYCEIQGAIELASNDIEREMAERELVEDKYFALRCRLQNHVDNLSIANHGASSNSGIQNSTNIRLPNIDIPIFQGDYMQYGTFIDLFNALIVNNSRLTSKTEKFFYLKSYLRNEPLALISQLPVTEHNFDVALRLLDCRYNNTRQIVAAHFHKLLNCNLVNKCTAQQLRHFTSDAKSIINSLLNLNIDKAGLFDALVTHLLKNKLDFQTKKALEENENNQNLITSEKFFDFLDKRCNILENLQGQDQKSDNFHCGHSSTVTTPHNRNTLLSNQTPSSDQQLTNASSTNQVTPSVLLGGTQFPPATPPGCGYCRHTGHRIYSCPKFSSISVPDRYKFVKSNRMCFGCLGSKHLLSNCISTGSCSICKKKHHVLLHLPAESPKRNVAISSINRTSLGNGQTNYPNSRPYNTPDDAVPTDTCNDDFSTPVTSRKTHTVENVPSLPHLSMLNLNGSHVLLATANILLYPRDGPPIQARALLDPGSQTSFICSSLVKQLNCVTYDQPLLVSGIFNNSQTINRMTDIIFHSAIDKSSCFEISCAVVDKITQALPQVSVDIPSLNIPPHLGSSLADPNFGTPSPIDLLLGAEIYYSLLKPGIHKLGKNLPSLIATHLGWLISGVVPPSCVNNNFKPLVLSTSFHVMSCEMPQEVYIDSLLEKFWAQEEISSVEKMSEADEKAEHIFTSTLKTLPDGKFQVDLPLIYETAYKTLGDSFVTAKHRFISLEKRLSKNLHVKNEYRKLLFEYVKLGHGKFVPLTLQTSELNHKYFVPHLCVLKESSTSTKVRIVFDYSSKSSSLVSLNDISLKGPRVQPELLDILIRFRNFKYALTADIEKMYRQIPLNPNFHFLQNALWRDSPSDTFSCLQMTTVSFGQTSAPYLACRVLKDIALKHPHFPQVQEALLSQTYVDDILTGANSLVELEKLYSLLKSVLASSGFNLHKFCSNSVEMTKTHFPESPPGKDLNLDENPSKILGIYWTPKLDTFKISTPLSPLDKCITKRIILSVVSQCYDPLGLINPVIVQGKLTMQQLWMLKLSWDEPITDPSLIKQWCKFLDSIQSLHKLHIPRYTLLDKTLCQVELHGFCDASSVAYGGCIYLRATYADCSASSQLLISKSRVAPLNKPLTVPKLELCAMTLLAKLYSRVKLILEKQLQMSSFILWSDSQIALSWIRSTPTRWSVFVCNRVTQIQQLTHLASWRHIRSHLNPADLLSRGQPLEFPSKFWFSGPSFLWNSSQDTAFYDTFSTVVNPPEENKKSLVVTTPSTNIFMALISRSSSFTKLIRSVAYVFKFVRSLKTPHDVENHFSSNDLDKALSFLVTRVQEHDFPNLLRVLCKKQIPSDKRLSSLNLFVDEDGIIRIGGRLSHADVSYQQKHPILLSSGSHFTSLVLQREHRRLGHSGPQNVLANVRLQFWPLGGLREIKRIINKCVMCHRFKAITAQQIMADLPKPRISPSRPFQTVGIDFGGPFLVKSSYIRKAPITKCYLALFVCFSSKAVHLELVSDLSTEAFIACLKRFTSRRGLPSVIYSDNATNFVGANNQLKELSKFFVNQFNPIREYLLSSSIDWKFIPPRSPHWGGLWEAGIKSVKSHLYKVVGTSIYTFEQFSTILSQIEAILNSRPLFPLSSDPSDLNPLTPGHFLIGAPLMSLPEKDISLIPVNRLKFWQHCSHVQQNFWRRWSVDYLNQLQNRPKWTSHRPDPKIGDMVLVKEDETPPLKWPLARITDVIPGKDGRIRSVQVKTTSGQYVRPIVKIVPLPTNDSISSQ